jgi:quercetin dioxygenase-like cupin family protein
MFKSIAAGLLVLLTVPAFGQDVMRYHVRHITVLAEDANTRVLRYAAKAGDRTPMHSHPASVIYVIKGGRVKTTLPDGTVTIATLKTGTAAIRPPVTHADEALDDVEMILVEIKPPRRPLHD